VLEDKEKLKKPSLSQKKLIGIGLELSYIIALPVIVFGLFGRWLDFKFGTEPIFVLVGVLTAIISTTIWINRKFKKYLK